MAKEKRLSKQLYSYWESIKEPGVAVPPETAVDPDALADIWDNCFVINARTNKYSYLGKNITAIAEGQSMLAKDIYATLMCPEKSNISSIVQEIKKSRSPIFQESQYTNPYQMVVKYRRCFLPLTGKGDAVQYILGGVRWKS